MPSPAEAHHAAQDAALRASVALATAVGGEPHVYTVVPAKAQLPYTVVGNDQILRANDACAAEAEIFSTVSFWSRPSPFDSGAQARAMGAAIIDALNVQLTLTGWDVDVWELQDERYQTDPDQSVHGILTFRYLLTQQTT